MSLYDDYKQRMDYLAANGRPNIVEMAKRFDDIASLSNSLGLDRTGVRNWFTGVNNVSTPSDIAAKFWLEANPKEDTHDASTTHDDDCVVLMVVANRTTSEKANKILSMLGCEVQEI